MEPSVSRSERRAEASVSRSRRPPATVFSREGDRVLTASLDRTARVWDVASVEPRRLDGGRVATTSAALSPEGDRLAVGFADGTMRLWDRSGLEIAARREHAGAVRSVT